MAVHWGPFRLNRCSAVTPSSSRRPVCSATTVVMRMLPPVTLRTALRSAHVYKASIRRVGPLIELALKGQYMPIPKA